MKAVDVSHKVVSRENWVEARKAHLAREKEFTRQRDELSRERRELPMSESMAENWRSGAAKVLQRQNAALEDFPLRRHDER